MLLDTERVKEESLTDFRQPGCEVKSCLTEISDSGLTKTPHGSQLRGGKTEEVKCIETELEQPASGKKEDALITQLFT